MKGFLTLGEADYDKGFRTRQGARHAMRWSTSRSRPTTSIGSSPILSTCDSRTGYFKGDIFGGQRPVDEGVFNLFVDNGDPDRKAMYYRLFFTDEKGNPLTLLGFKDVHGGDGSDVWTDTTTLFTRILKGHVGPEADGGASVLAAGIIRIHFLDFLEGADHVPSGRARVSPLALRASHRFGSLFLSKLWDVYAHHVLPSSPF